MTNAPGNAGRGRGGIVVGGLRRQPHGWLARVAVAGSGRRCNPPRGGRRDLAAGSHAAGHRDESVRGPPHRGWHADRLQLRGGSRMVLDSQRWKCVEAVPPLLFSVEGLSAVRGRGARPAGLADGRRGTGGRTSATITSCSTRTSRLAYVLPARVDLRPLRGSYVKLDAQRRAGGRRDLARRRSPSPTRRDGRCSSPGSDRRGTRTRSGGHACARPLAAPGRADGVRHGASCSTWCRSGSTYVCTSRPETSSCTSSRARRSTTSRTSIVEKQLWRDALR